jgi:hypothetical protein
MAIIRNHKRTQYWEIGIRVFLIALLIPSKTNRLARTIFKDIILAAKAVVKTIKATIG